MPIKKLLFAVSLFALSPIAQASFGYYRVVTVDHTKVPNTDQSNYPVLVSSSTAYSSSLATVANGGKVQNSNGYDIGFYTNADCSTGKLNWETEDYSATTGVARYWVNLASLSHTSDTVFYLCYGDATISTDQSNKTAVWDSNYKAVWHFPNGTTLTANDSTSNANNLTMQNTPTATAGQIDGAVHTIASSTQYLSITPHVLGSATAVSIEAWAYPTTYLNTYTTVVTNGGTASGYASLLIHNDGKLGCFLLANSNVSYDDTGSHTLALNAWNSLAMTYNSSAGLIGYVNGAQDATVSANGSLATPTGTTYLNINQDQGNSPRFMTGSYDEVRISNIARSADWLQTTYNNEISPTTFESFGSETPISGGGGTGVNIQGVKVIIQ